MMLLAQAESSPALSTELTTLIQTFAHNKNIAEVEPSLQKEAKKHLAYSEWDEAERLKLLRPLTQEQIAALPADQRLAQASAMKAVMLMRYVLNKANNYKLSQDNLERCARLATLLKAPKPFVTAFLLEATGTLSAQQRYFIRRIISRSLSSYSIDQNRIRSLAEMNKLAHTDLLAMIDKSQFSFEHAFEFSLGISELNATKVNERVMYYTKELLSLSQDLAKVNDRQRADASAALHPKTLSMLDFIGILEASQYKEFTDLMTEDHKRELQNVVSSLSLEIMRLDKADFYGSKNLHLFIDLLRL